MCVDALLGQGLEDPVVVTGSSGGVGSLAVALLAKLGHHVIASTGSEGAHAMLKELGAAEILGRHELSEASERPMLKSVYGGAVDTVGGAHASKPRQKLKGRRKRGGLRSRGRPRLEPHRLPPLSCAG